MFLKVKVNGKENEAVTDPDNIILSVESDKAEQKSSFTFQIFDSVSALKSNKPVYEESTIDRYVYLKSGYFIANTEYICVVKADDNGKTISSLPVTFFTALREKDFTAKWIENKDFDGSVSFFEKTFDIKSGYLSAKLYIVGLGFYKSYINGKETDDYYFKPVLTDFDRRTGLNNADYNEENFNNGKKTVSFNTFDVTDKLKVGKNSINVMLGTGWYCNTDKLITDPSYNYGTPKLIFELRVKYKDKEVKVISDKDCLVKNTNIKSQLFKGDEIDFTKPKQDFNLCRTAKAPSGKLIPSETDNDVVIEKIAPVSEKTENGITELDFGKNHTGRLYLKVKGKRGALLTVKYYESKKNGKLNPYTSRWDAYEFVTKKKVGYLDQQGIYVLSGEEDEIKPYFSWCGYRYATIEVSDGQLEIKEVLSYFITSKIKQDGDFYSSNEVLNDIHRAFILTQRSNMHCGVPSDCPHREKLPYTGDGQLAAESAMYIFGAENFYRKWLKDIIAAQGKNGFIPYTAPYIAGGGGYWWSNAIAVVPFVLYRFTGDKGVLKSAFPSLLALIEYYKTACDEDYVINKSYLTWCLGDWLTPEKTVSDKNFINTLAFYYAVESGEEFGKILGKKQKVKELSALKQSIKAGINKRYFDKEKLLYSNGIQGENILPALFNIVPEKYQKAYATALIEKYEKNGHFDTGIVLTPKLLDFLTSVNRTDLALNILTAKDGPSFYCMLQQETTLCEHWYKHWPGAPDSNVSHNHPMFGSVVAWIYKNVAGLDLSEYQGGIINFSPKAIKSVAKAGAKKNTANGVAEINYEYANDLCLTIKVPHGTVGMLTLKEFNGNAEINGTVTESESKNYIKYTLKGGNYSIKIYDAGENL